MDWNKLGALGSAVGGLFTVLVFLATVWPWPQIKKRKGHRNQSLASMVPKLITVPLLNLAGSLNGFNLCSMAPNL